MAKPCASFSLNSFTRCEAHAIPMIARPMRTQPMNVASTGWVMTNDQSKAGRWGRSGTPGRSPTLIAQRKRTDATTKSKSVSTTRLEARVG